MFNFQNPSAPKTITKPVLDPQTAALQHAFGAMINGGMGSGLDPATGKLTQALYNQGSGEDAQAGPLEGYAQYTSRPEGKYFQTGDSYDRYSPEGEYEASAHFKDPQTGLDTWGPLIVGAFAGLGAMGALGGGGAVAGSGAAGSAGAGMTGAGFGEAGLMYAGADAAAAGTLGGGFMGGAGGVGAAGAGMSAGFLGDATAAGYGGLDAASAATMGGGGSLGSGGAAGAAAGSNSWLGNIQKALGLGGGGGSGGMDWTSLAGQGLNALSGLYGASQAGKASDAQLQAAREAMALQEPFRQGGMKGLNRLLDLYGLSGNTGAQGYGSAMKKFGMEDFNADPGYQFRQSEGEKGMARAAAANGGLGSGRYLKDAMRFNQGLATEEYGRAYDRYGTDIARQINPLQALAGQGQSAANTIGEYRTQAGNAQAAGAVGKANAITGAVGQGWSMYQNQQQQNQQNAMFNRLFGSI
jgi:hypothetical protein